MYLFSVYHPRPIQVFRRISSFVQKGGENGQTIYILKHKMRKKRAPLPRMYPLQRISSLTHTSIQGRYPHLLKRVVKTDKPVIPQLNLLVTALFIYGIAVDEITNNNFNFNQNISKLKFSVYSDTFIKRTARDSPFPCVFHQQ